jgi:hypothetical protein
MRTYLKLDGVESELESFDIDMYREVNANGEIRGRVKQVSIKIRKDSRWDKGSIINWLADYDKEKEGEVIIYEDDKKQKKFKTIKFQKAKVGNYSEKFIRDDDALVFESFTIYAEVISIDSAKFDMEWPAY